jgi:pimeloyl-ACP methyl ester carboxylesterase
MSAVICYIHGLNSSHNSFSYMEKEVGGVAKIDYKSYQPLELSIAQVEKQLPKDQPLILIGHSLGGVIALEIALNKQHDVQKVVTISAPLGGSRFAFWAQYFFGGLPVLSDLTPYSALITRFTIETPDCPVLSIISTGGALPFSPEPNDSVVSIASQKALKYTKKVEVKANHFEVLMHDKTFEAVRKFISAEA